MLRKYLRVMFGVGARPFWVGFWVGIVLFGLYILAGYHQAKLREDARRAACYAGVTRGPYVGRISPEDAQAIIQACLEGRRF